MPEPIFPNIIPVPPPRDGIVLWVCVLCVVVTLIIGLFYLGHGYYASIGTSAPPPCTVRYEHPCMVHTMDGDVQVVIRDHLVGNRASRSYEVIDVQR